MRIREGDPLEIYTDRDGEVIFKKYSPIGEISQFAAQYAETLNKTCSLAVVICDRDTVIASAGLPKREYADRKLSKELEEITERLPALAENTWNREKRCNYGEFLESMEELSAKVEKLLK